MIRVLILVVIAISIGSFFVTTAPGKHHPNPGKSDPYAGYCYPKLPIRVKVTDIGLTGNCVKAN